MRKPLLYAYFGHHKCASRWIVGITTDVCIRLGMKHVVGDVITVGNQNLNGFTLRHELDSLANVNFLSYINAVQGRVDQLGIFKGFHVIRDPRDICVSAYYSHLYSHPTGSKDAKHIAETRKSLERLPKDEGLLQVIRDRREQFETMYSWDYSQPNVLELKMEDLVNNPYQGFLDIFHYLGLLDATHFSIRKRLAHLFLTVVPNIHGNSNRLVRFFAKADKIPAECLLGYVHNHRFSKKAGGRNQGEENTRSHYRKGLSGDWVNHFAADHIEFFKENYNGLLTKLGYESDDTW